MAPAAGRWKTMDALADPTHPDHAEHAAWVTDITGSYAPFDPAFLDIPAVNRVLAEQFRRTRSGGKHGN